MSNLREQYERETGNPYHRNDLYKPTYTDWLERLAACAEQLAEACKALLTSEVSDDPQDGIKAVHLASAALAKYEAACKGGGE
jgi:hypothetical protein